MKLLGKQRAQSLWAASAISSVQTATRPLIWDSTSGDNKGPHLSFAHGAFPSRLRMRERVAEEQHIEFCMSGTCVEEVVAARPFQTPGPIRSLFEEKMLHFSQKKPMFLFFFCRCQLEQITPRGKNMAFQGYLLAPRFHVFCCFLSSSFFVRLFSRRRLPASVKSVDGSEVVPKSP